MMPKIPNIDILNLLLVCDAEAGVLYWRLRPRSMFPTDRAFNTWNARYGNCRALTKPTRGYHRITINAQRFPLHRIIWKMVHGEDPVEIDHIDGNPDNNSIVNLRNVSHLENLQNQKRRSTNTTGKAGVFRGPSGKFQAFLRVNQTNTYLGSFLTADQASEAYEAAKAQAGYHPNHGVRS